MADKKEKEKPRKDCIIEIPCIHAEIKIKPIGK